jgi:hypothetical protein
MKFAGALNMALSKTKRENNKSKINQTDIDSKSQKSGTKIETNLNYNKVTIRSLPYFFWFIGAWFLSGGFVLLYNMIVGDNPEKKLFNLFNGKQAWEYVVVACLLVIGFSMFIVARYESITLDRKVNKIFNLIIIWLNYQNFI